MQLGQIPLQILVSLGLLICAVIAAIMFDLIRGKNEQLREMMIELKIRNEESARREQLLREQLLMETPPLAVPVDASAEIKLAAQAEIATATAQTAGYRPRPQRNQVPSNDSQAAIEGGLAMAGSRTYSLAHSRNLSLFKETEPRASAIRNVETIEIAIAPPVKLCLHAAHSLEVSVISPKNLMPVERRAPYRGLKLKNLVVESIVIEIIPSNGPAQPALLLMENIAASGQKKGDSHLIGRRSASTNHRGLLAAVFAATTSSAYALDVATSKYHDETVLAV